MKITTTAIEKNIINIDTLSYQYDLEDKELFLEEGYVYDIYTYNNGKLYKDSIDLKENK